MPSQPEVKLGNVKRYAAAENHIFRGSFHNRVRNEKITNDIRKGGRIFAARRTIYALALNLFCDLRIVYEIKKPLRTKKTGTPINPAFVNEKRTFWIGDAGLK